MPSRNGNVVELYLQALRTAHSTNAYTAETSFYNAIGNLFNAVGETLNPRVLYLPHPSTNASTKLPDGGLYILPRRQQARPLPGQRPERGVVEIKPPAPPRRSADPKTPIDALAELRGSQQVRAYLTDFNLCLITNYHQFQLLNLPGAQPRILESYNLTRTAEELWDAPLATLVHQHATTLPDFLARAFTRRVPLEKPKDLAWLLASYAREARARAKMHPLAAFAAVKSALQDSLGITFEGDKGEHFFLSTLIQTLFYGIFSAWVLWRATPEGRVPQIPLLGPGLEALPPPPTFDWRLSADYLRIPVLRQLFHAITEPGALNTVQIREVLDHATDALNRVQPGFFATFNEADAVNYFYEPFLQAFDPDLRKQFGVWYTPREIVRYMVERVDHLLRTELKEPLGLASPNVQVLDPCCGTGAYLVEVLNRIHRTLLEQAGDDTGYVGSDLRRAATTRIFGFEIMPAPFVIAHLQIAMLLAREDINAPLADSQRAQVFLTNALTGWVPIRHPQSNFGFPALIEERDSAEAIKQADTILVILGNPPYNGYAGISKMDEERDLTTAYRIATPGLPAPQGQGLNDLYIRFFRIAERRITQNREHRGIVSLISNYSWLDGLSHPTMRHRLLHDFESLYIDNLHGDRRISEYAPDGRTSETVFATRGSSVGIKVGTAVVTLVKNGTDHDAEGLKYRDFEDADAAARRLHLLDSSVESDPYLRLGPNARLGLPFKPRTFTSNYLDWPRLPELFPIGFAGIKTARDPLLTDIDKGRLIKRLCNYLDPRVTDAIFARSVPMALVDTASFDAIQVRRTLQAQFEQVRSNNPDKYLSYEAYVESKVQPFYYRPYDLRWIYLERNTKLIERMRDEYLDAFMEDTPTLVSAQSNRRAYDGPCFTKRLTTFHLNEKGSSLFPAWTRYNSMPGQVNMVTNISNTLYEHASMHNLDTVDFLPYVLAVMHTPRYKEDNSGALLGDWPRIPLPATQDLLTTSANLGLQLATLLDPESDLILAAEWSSFAKLIMPPELPEGAPSRDERNAARLALTAYWGRVQGAAVQPTLGDARKRKWSALERDRLTTLAVARSLSLNEVLTILGERCVDVHLNNSSLWSGVPIRVWEYTLGGYQVLKKWLSYRELSLLGRPLREDEVRYFAQVVRRITAILLLGPALDASYAAILPTATGLPTSEAPARIR